MASVSQVPGHHGHPGVVAVRPVGRGLAQELALALLLPILLSVLDQVQKLEDALEGIVQWMALGLHGQPGAVAVSLVGRGLLQELVLALLTILAPVLDQVQILEDALEGIVQCAEKIAQESSCLSAALMESPITASVCSKRPPVSLVKQSLWLVMESAEVQKRGVCLRG